MVSVFSGSIQSKRKAELQEIAVALRISDKGTKEELQTRIKKHLDDNQQLADDISFSGLFVKRKKSLQHQPVVLNRPAASSASESTNEIVAKSSDSPMHTRSSRRISGVAIIHEATPIPEAREVSMMLKNAAFSPDATYGSPMKAMDKETPLRVDKGESGTATPRSIMRNFSKPSIAVATASLKELQANTKQTTRKLLTLSRLVLSNSTNVWLISALLELVCILYVVIPWHTIEILPPQRLGARNVPLIVPYPSLAILESVSFWAILFHWAIPSVVLPAIFGSLVLFHSSNSSTARVPRALLFDPLTASIMRLAAQYAYPYETLGLGDQCLDILGPRWRILNASFAAALAFAEAIATAPRNYAEARLRQRATPRRAPQAEKSLL